MNPDDVTDEPEIKKKGIHSIFIQQLISEDTNLHLVSSTSDGRRSDEFGKKRMNLIEIGLRIYPAENLKLRGKTDLYQYGLFCGVGQRT